LKDIGAEMGRSIEIFYCCNLEGKGERERDLHLVLFV
jgi:hypothetical protein